MIERLICLAALVIGYGFGMIQVAQIYSKTKNVNIREKGSGNAGTTNMFRVMGIKAGIITLLGDCAKCVAAVLLTKWIFISLCGFKIDPIAMTLYAGLGAALGHDFPFYLHFKGGKGMATTAALICCLGTWKLIIPGLVVFVGTVILTQYVSLGSMLTVGLACIEFIVFTEVGWINVDPSWRADCYIIFILLTLLLLWQHRKNISRLANHCEKKFYFRTAKQIEEDEAAHRETQVNAKVERVQQKAEKKVDRLQNKGEKKVDKLQGSSARQERKADRLQTRTERRIDHVQSKANYKEQKVQIKAEYKQEINSNWAGKIAEHAPNALKKNNPPRE